MKYIYIITFTLLFKLTLSPKADIPVGDLFNLVHVPGGYHNYTITLLLLLLLPFIIIYRNNKLSNKFFEAFKYWIPWIIFIIIRTGPDGNGLWKLAMYGGRVVMPSIFIVIMYYCNRDVFEKYFMKTLLGVNLFVVFYVAVGSYISNIEFYYDIGFSRGLGITIAYYLMSGEWKEKPSVIVPVLLLFTGMMFYIGSRGPLLFTIFTLMAWFGIKSRRNSIRIFVICYMVLSVLFFIMIIPSINKQFTSLMTHDNQVTIENAADNRTSVYLPTLNIWTKHFLVGVGFGNWWDHYKKEYLPSYSWFVQKMKYQRERDYTYPHNLILEILSELGIIGMMLFILLFFPYMRYFNSIEAYNYLVVLGFLFAMTSSDLTQNSAPLIFSLLSVMKYKDQQKLLKNEL